MSIKAHEIISILERAFPPKLACEWDNSGLQAGDPDQRISQVVVGLDPDAALIKKAGDRAGRMAVTHHPLIFSPLNRVTPQGSGAEPLVYSAVTQGTVVYAAHTNADFAEGGLNDRLCGLFGIGDCEPIIRVPFGSHAKIVVFVPRGHEDKVRRAMAQAGAGWIGNYSECSFMSEGTGTFLPLEGTNPFLGKQGHLERADELRLEMIAPMERVEGVIEAMRAVHPYEEAAFDVYELARPRQIRGEGRIGVLSKKLTPQGFVNRVKKALGVRFLRVTPGRAKSIRRVAVVSGSGASFIPQVIGRVDVLVTGDVKHHEAKAAEAAGLMIVHATHHALEMPFVDLAADVLKKALPKLKVIRFRSRDPLETL